VQVRVQRADDLRRQVAVDDAEIGARCLARIRRVEQERLEAGAPQRVGVRIGVTADG
jgi:hypothetical protein